MFCIAAVGNIFSVTRFQCDIVTLESRPHSASLRAGNNDSRATMWHLSAPYLHKYIITKQSLIATNSEEFSCRAVKPVLTQ